ncbi:hypothetical protein [Streptomyces seoulensis]|uniref:hypothetical protein n=1 Tax=Streptomyces seoulensis TaxID=73044 RepID=UPI001FCAA85B|nr:hypothetical protein [Streptomyces seoulensis]BDH07197.1 hypothetical protein HEK131_44240 [Streptomyces seoulensis]
MPADPARAAGRRAVSPLDHRVEAATGYDIDTLWTYRDRGVLVEPHAELVDRHRELSAAQTGVTFHLRLLAHLTSGEFPVDYALLDRIDRTVDQLKDAAGVRETTARWVLALLEPIEAAATATTPDERTLSGDDQAALLALAGGAKLREHLLTGRMSVTTASGTRIPHTTLQRLEEAGLVVRDTSHPVHAGQPVALTDTGRAALLTSRRPAASPVPVPPARPGAWPSTSPQRR